MAAKCWEDIPVHFPIAVLHEYVIMPEPIYGIIELPLPPAWANPDSLIQTGNTVSFDVPIRRFYHSRGGKLGVTKLLQYEAGFSPDMQVWQAYYHDHIIRNEMEYVPIGC